jgi:hypothetical protein
MGFAVKKKVPLGQDFLPVLQFFPISIIPPMFHALLSIAAAV